MSTLTKQRRTRIRNGKAVIDNPAPRMNPRSFKVSLQVCRFQTGVVSGSVTSRTLVLSDPEAASWG